MSGETRGLELFTPSDGWSRIFLTVSRSPTLKVKNEKQKKKLEDTVKLILLLLIFCLCVLSSILPLLFFLPVT